VTRVAAQLLKERLPRCRHVVILCARGVSAFRRCRSPRAAARRRLVSLARSTSEATRARLRVRPARAAGAQPALVLRRLHHTHPAAHVRVLGAAILGAKESIFSGLRGLEPRVRVAARQHILFYAEGGHVEAVDHVLRGHLHPYGRALRHVQRVDLARAVRMLELPHPLLADGVDLHGASFRRLLDVEVADRRPREDADPQKRRNHHPGRLQQHVAGGRIGPIRPRTAPVADGKVQDGDNHASGKQQAQRDQHEVDQVDVGGYRRGLIRKEREVPHGWRRWRVRALWRVCRETLRRNVFTIILRAGIVLHSGTRGSRAWWCRVRGCCRGRRAAGRRAGRAG